MVKFETSHIPDEALQAHDSALDIALRAAEAAGRVLMDMYSQPHEIRYKGAIDLVTEADVASESTIKSLVTARSKVDIIYHQMCIWKRGGFKCSRCPCHIFVNCLYCSSAP